MIVVCGEALMDVFAGADTATGMALEAQVGGSPFNVAVGLARLLQPAALFGALSRDFLGERLMNALRDEGVLTDTLAVVDAPTTLGLVGMDKRGVPSYAFYGERGADRQVHADALLRWPAGAVAVHVGSFSTVVEPVASTLRTVVERFRSELLISFDPNVRLNVEPELARWREVLEWMLTRSHLLKISDEDLALIRPGLAPRQFCAEALAAGVRLVIVTRGEGGALGATRAGMLEVPAVAVEVIDTVGAGDTFQAACLTWLAEQGYLKVEALAALPMAQLGELLVFSIRAAAITCSRRGADLPRRTELAP